MLLSHCSKSIFRFLLLQLLIVLDYLVVVLLLRLLFFSLVNKLSPPFAVERAALIVCRAAVNRCLGAKALLTRMENHLLLNLLGKRFHLPSRLVADYPQTLLGNRSLLATYYRQYANEYYFERNPLLFPYILTYYTLEKKIFCPHHIPIELLENECQFFQLSNASIYRERNRTTSYQYFPRKRHLKHERWIELASFVAGILFMIAISTETVRGAEASWSVASVLELFGTFLLTSSILSRIVLTRSDHRDLSRKKSFLFDVFASLVSITLIAIETFGRPRDSRLLPLFIMICKTVRLLMMIGHLRILRLVWLTCIHR